MNRGNKLVNYFMGILLLVNSVSQVTALPMLKSGGLEEVDDTTIPVVYKVVPGQEITIDASDSYDPDGDSISFLWTYEEQLSSYAKSVDIEGNTQSVVDIRIPQDLIEDSIVLKLDVKDNSEYRLSSYKQIILLAKKELKILSTPQLNAKVDNEYTYMLEVDFDSSDSISFTPLRMPQWLEVVQTNSSNGYLLLQGTPRINDVENDNTVEISVSNGDNEISQLFVISVADGIKSGEIGVESDTLVYQINRYDDDAEEYNNNIVCLDNKYLEIVTNNFKDIGNSAVGFIFRNIIIPEDKEMVKAIIRFSVDEGAEGTNNIKISGILENNSPSFSENKNDITSRAQTHSEVLWEFTTWSNEENYEYTTDISELINEIRAQDNWFSGNSIGFVLEGEGKQKVKSFEGALNKNERPALIIILGEKEENKSTGIWNDEINTLKVYPNPTNGILNINSGNEEISLISIYDVSGRLIKVITNDENFKTHLDIDVSNLRRGTYILQVKTMLEKQYSIKFNKI